MNFAGEITPLQLSLMIASVTLVLMAFVAVLVRTLPLQRLFKRRSAVHGEESSALVSAAVIVFAHDDFNALSELLPQILSQDYAPGFEVIVVNDGDSAEVRDVAEHFMLNHPNLYFTAAPDGARNLSRKKLALTLGIKAAKSPVVVHTTSTARIFSDKWLRSIMRHFDPAGAVDVVIGYAAAPPYDDRTLGARARSFDSAVDALGWMGPATAGRPWRGIEHNLAYRRDLFFRNKGFSRHLNLRDGDDDIFISEIARGYNTVVELSPESVVDISGDNGRRAFAERMSRRRFTKKFIPSHPRVAGTVASIAYFLAPLPLVAVPFVGPMSGISWICVAFILLCWYLTGMLWNPALKILRGRKFMLSTPLLAFTRPLRIVSRTSRSLIFKGKRYTWE